PVHGPVPHLQAARPGPDLRHLPAAGAGARGRHHDAGSVRLTHPPGGGRGTGAAADGGSDATSATGGPGAGPLRPDPERVDRHRHRRSDPQLLRHHRLWELTFMAFEQPELGMALRELAIARDASFAERRQTYVD